VAGKNSFSQAAVSHSFQQDIEVSVPGKGGPTLIKQGETKALSYVPTSGSVNFVVKYKNGRKTETRNVQVTVTNGAVNIPEAPGASREAEKTDSSTTSAPPRRSDSSPGPSQDFNPGVGQVNIVKNLTSNIASFNLRLHNDAKGKGDLLFIGNVFTGLAAQAGDTIVSRELVRPGLVELTVIYKMSYTSFGGVGQSFTLAQQALVYMVTDSSQVITISDNDFFDFASLAADIPIRFKNVGGVTLYPKTSDKKLRALRPGKNSRTTKFQLARSTMWYYYDANNVQRLAVWELVPGDKPVIQIRAMDHVYGTGR
jgi:hypothetical protein